MPLARRRSPLRWPLALLLVLILGEGATRLVEWATDRDYSAPDWATSDRMLYAPHPFVGYVPTAGYATPEGAKHAASVNSMGFRGPEFEPRKAAGTFRVVCIGGSTTWGTGASADDRTWAAHLQRGLNASLPEGSPYQRVEVINAGVSGYTTLESFVNLKMRLLPLEPDLVIVYHAANDARALRRSPFRHDYSHVRQTWTDPPRPLLDDWLWWSHLYGVFRDWQADTAAHSLRGRLYVPDYEELEQRNADDIAPGLENFAWTLREIVAIARLHGAEVMLSTFTWRPGEEPGAVQQKWKEDFIPILERLNAVTVSVSKSMGTLLADVRGRGPKRLVDFHDVVHFTDEGHARVAAVMVGTINQSGILGRPPRPRAGGMGGGGMGAGAMGAGAMGASGGMGAAPVTGQEAGMGAGADGAGGDSDGR